MLTPGKGAVSRADLLGILATEGEQALANMAFAFGYQRQAIEQPTATADDLPETTTETPAPIPKSIERPRKLPSAVFFYVAERTRKQPDEQPNRPEVPAWFKKAELLSEDACPESGTVRLPEYPPLIRWPRLWPFLRMVLGLTYASRQPDIPRIVRNMATGVCVRQLPRQKQQGWSTKICILLDFQSQTEPFYHDFNLLWAKLRQLHGSLGIDVRILHGEAGLKTQYRNLKGDNVKPWRIPDVVTSLLILSDLGLLAESPRQQQGWQRYGRQLRAAGCKPLVLCPVPEAMHDKRLRSLFTIYCWDRNSRLHGKSVGVGFVDQGEVKQRSGVEIILVLLSAAVVIEPALLRAVRNLLPADQVNVADEAGFWQHPDISSSTQGCCYKSLSAVEKYQQQLSNPDFLTTINIAGSTEQKQFKERLVKLVDRHHKYLPQSVRMMEMQQCERLLPDTVDSKTLSEINRWQQAMAKTCFHKANNVSLQEWNQQYIVSLPLDILHNPVIAALWALAQKDKLSRGEIVQFPVTINKQDADFILAGEASHNSRMCRLFQTGHELRITETDPNTELPCSYYADLTLAGDLLIETESNHQQKDESTWQWQNATDTIANGNSRLLVELQQGMRQVSLSNESEILLLKSFTKPDWASQIGRDPEGLWVEFEQQGGSWRVYWPAWGGALGHDQYGLYSDLNIKGIIQRCRWIPPGTFQMGSPQTEKERIENEIQHQVTLTQGFWLADTTCTQALWQVVMGDNPSHFKEGVYHPMEQVSWDDVQLFLKQLNYLMLGLDAKLPTEAQWEYACRAGTTSPFSFGENITTEQVNYDGDFPNSGGNKGLNRGKTVPVKSLPANPWGLYEMHGNIWEWCHDWYADYPQAASVDPSGGGTGAVRILRGGSWIITDKFTRSAYRSGRSSDYRHYLIGFRFAPGQAGSSAAEPQVAATERGRADKQQRGVLEQLWDKVNPKK